MIDTYDKILKDLEVRGVQGRVARILTNGGLARVVCETAAETLEFQIETVLYEMEELYPDSTYEIIYSEE